MAKPQASPTAPTLADPLLQGGLKHPDPASPSAILVASAMGVAFGFAIQKGRVFEPHYISDQLSMSRFLMLKMFLTAAAASLAVTSALSMTAFGRSRVAGARKWAYNGYRGIAAALAGGLTLGVGMALSGACPGTGPVQLGAGVASAVYTVGGGFAGALAFGLIEPRVLQPSGLLHAWSVSRPTFDALFGLPFHVVGFAMAAAMAFAAFSLESMFPWRSDLPQIGRVNEPVSITSYAWPPMLSGLVIGSLQLPGLLFVKDTIGSSRAYVTAVVQVGNRLFPSLFKNAYFCGCACGVGNYQQLAWLVSSVVGAFLAAAMSNDLGTSEGFGALVSFVGGFLTVFGGRLAGGCTSGQGISGNAVLGVISPIATASMFVGGMAAKAVLSRL
eukprot:m51a1_g4595 hypothetical protein (387) ;mRNA; f:206165-207612